MTHQFLRTAQVFVLINLLSQLIWLIHLNFPHILPINYEDLKPVIYSVGLINLSATIFICIYLYKKGFTAFFIIASLDALYYLYLLIDWIDYIELSVSLEQYDIAFYGYMAISLLYGLVLVFSATRQKIWLKRAGLVILITFAFNFIFEFMPVISQNEIVTFLFQIFDFANLAAFAFFILNFQDEIRDFPRQNDTVLDEPA